MRSGWYMGKFRPLLHKQKGLLLQQGRQLTMQFDNLGLPTYYTHDWVPVPSNSVLELQNYNEERQEVTLSVQQKMYLRKVRNGKFDFHGEEYTL